MHSELVNLGYRVVNNKGVYKKWKLKVVISDVYVSFKHKKYLPAISIPIEHALPIATEGLDERWVPLSFLNRSHAIHEVGHWESGDVYHFPKENFYFEKSDGYLYLSNRNGVNKFNSKIELVGYLERRFIE